MDISEALKEIGEDLLDKLRPYIIRRNRADLRVNPDFFQEDDTPMRMPTQTVCGKYYALSDAQRTAYLAVLEVFRFSADIPAEEDRDAGRGECKGFACTIYRVGEFVDVDEKIGNYLDNYRSMTLRHLLRRFESSPYAFKRSVEDLIQRHERALADLRDSTKLCFNPKGIDLGENDNDDEDEDTASDFIDTIICRPGSPVNGLFFKDGKDQEFIAGLESDLSVLNEMLGHANVLLRGDSKLALLKEKITPSVNQKQGGRDPLLEPCEALPTLDNLPDGAPRRVVIFSMFIDTARHLAQELSRTYGKDMVMLAVDKPSGTQASLNLDGVRIVHSATEVKACFDVKADNDNLWTAPRILITTDKFSEGVNLNRAGLLVNYDIPWNPVRVIQRLGRINRINACWFETIRVYNLYLEYRHTDVTSGLAPGWASPQEIAAQKLKVIHNLFFEDATILGDEEAGGERPFDTIDRAAGADSEPTSEETQIRLRYQEALEMRRDKNESIATFEERLLAYGTGMKTVRLGRPEANMLIFKQNGAQIKAEILDGLHTWDLDKRTQSIKLLDALSQIASEPADPCPKPDRFPDKYETIEQRMGRAPSRVEGTTQSGGPASPLEKALDVVDAWKKRADLQDLLLDLADVYDACEQRGLTENLISQISKAGSPANREQVEAIMKAASTATKSYASSTMTATQVAPQEPILTFVNEITENA